MRVGRPLGRRRASLMDVRPVPPSLQEVDRAADAARRHPRGPADRRRARPPRRPTGRATDGGAHRRRPGDRGAARRGCAGVPVDQLPTGIMPLPADYALWTADAAGRYDSVIVPYEPRSPAPGADEGALIWIGVWVEASAAGADARLDGFIDARQALAFTFASLTERIGDRALLGGWTLGGEYARPREVFLVYVRVGQLVGLVEWLDNTDRPQVDAAVELARRLEARFRALGPTP